MFPLLKTIHKLSTNQKPFNSIRRWLQVEQNSYVLNLFNGNIEASSVFPFPNVKVNDQINDLIIPIQDFFSKSFDPRKNDTEANLSKEDYQTIRNLGLFKLLIPKEYGGFGLTITENSKVMEVVGSFDLSISYGILMHELGCIAIDKFGSKEQKEMFLTRAANGDLISFCLGEPSVNSNHPFLKTTAHIHDNDYYILNGYKVWVPFGTNANIYAVFATTTDGFPKTTAFLLDKSAEGITLGQPGDKIGLKSINTSKVYFKNVKVLKKNILGGEGNGVLVAMKTLGICRPSLAAALSGNMKKVIGITANFIVKKHIDPRIYKGIQDHLTQMSTLHYAIESVAYLISCNRDKDWTSGRLESVICKFVATTFAFTTCDLAMAILGGEGLLNEVTLERSLRDIRVLRTLSIDNDVLKLFVAKQGIQYARVIKSTNQMPKGAKPMALFTNANLTNIQNVALPSQNFHKLVHPELISVSNFIARAVSIVAETIQNIITNYSYEIIDEQAMLAKIGDVIFDIYTSSVVLSRATYSLNEKLPTAKYEKMLAELFCVHAFKRILYKINCINWEEHYNQMYNMSSIYKDVCKNRGVIQKSPFD